MILPIYIYGQPVLRRVAEDIPTDYPELKTLIENMFETMDASDGIGLAAPQVGLNIRVIVIGLDALADNFPEYIGFRHAYINPHIIEYDEESEEKIMEEGCLSIPGIHEKVKRPTRILVEYLDEELKLHKEWVEGYLARVMQHEIDHLDGKLFIDHISAFRKQIIRKKLKALLEGDFRCSYKTKVGRSS